ncbi:T9SS type A sorting domain-containing protein [Ferruginibacter profundus]
MKNIFTSVLVITHLLFCNKVFSVPKLNSLPGATATIFLDFDGHFVQSTLWNNGAAFYCSPSGMSDVQITESFDRVAEDYRPFNINITTDSAVFEMVPLNKRIRIIITPTSAWSPGVGGVSWIGSFNWGDDTPAFVFCDRLGPNSPKMVGECCSHESGHTIGLSHQSKYGTDCNTPIETYNTGNGSGETGWAPIMGNSYNRNMSNWNNGPTPYGCTTLQDNLSIITTMNGFGYRADDYADTLNANTFVLNGTTFTANGIISTDADKDAFKFTMAQNSTFHLTAVPFNVGADYMGANLDIKIELYNAAANLIATCNPATMSVTIDTILNAGIYYLKIDGTGNINTGEYGSLGAYTLNGFTGILPIHDVSLGGKTENENHRLNWHITTDEQVKTIAIETAEDGIHFIELTTAATAATQFLYQPDKKSTIYYRIKVTSVLDQVIYSNTIALKSPGKTNLPAVISAVVHNEITINAAANYQYRLLDINGRVVITGTGTGGINKIDISNQPGGMYMLQLFNNGQQQTQKIFKQ